MRSAQRGPEERFTCWPGILLLPPPSWEDRVWETCLPMGQALLAPWAWSPGALLGRKAGRPLHPTHLPPVAAMRLMQIFLFVFVIRGESALIYIKW